MTKGEKLLYDLNPWLLSSVAGVLTLVQFGLTIFRSNPSGVPWVNYMGHAVWIAGVVFAILPIVTLRGRGRVEEGKSYIHTTTLVDTGVYAVVRHPQGGTAWLLLNLGLILVGQTWPIAILGAVSTVLVYMDALKTDQYCIEKFGDDYRLYMQRVPRLNFLLGIVRLLRRRTREKGGRNDEGQWVH